MSKIIIYTNEQCPYCKQIKEELNKNGFGYEERLTKDWLEDWQNISSLTGMPTVPTIYFENNYLVPSRDFRNPQHLLDMLRDFKESKFTIEQQSLEKLKTLNYNISIAFAKLDQVIRKIETKINK